MPVLVAHPDDVEYGTSSAVAAWTARAWRWPSAADSRRTGMDSSTPAQTAEVGTREQVAGSHSFGVTQVNFLDYPDGVWITAWP